MKPPEEHRYGKGWMLGEVEGRQFYTDGCSMFLCKGEPPTPNCKLPDGHMAHAFKACVPKRLIPTKAVDRKKIIRWRGEIEVVIFKGRSGIQLQYYNHVQENYCSEWYLGKVQDPVSGERALVAKENGLVVAVVMPCRYR